jgi:hypothetical protein
MDVMSHALFVENVLAELEKINVCFLLEFLKANAARKFAVFFVYPPHILYFSNLLSHQLFTKIQVFMLSLLSGAFICLILF